MRDRLVWVAHQYSDVSVTCSQTFGPASQPTSNTHGLICLVRYLDVSQLQIQANHDSRHAVPLFGALTQ